MMVVTCRPLRHTFRLGNALWIIASTIGVAERIGARVLIPDWEYRPWFSIPDEMFGFDPSARLSEEFATHLHEIVARPYLQDFSLWASVSETIRRFFSPSPRAREVIDRREEELPPRPRISVHVRRGDLTDPRVQEYHPLRSLRYYINALTLVSRKRPVVVFSDDPEWCERVFVPIMRSYWSDHDYVVFFGQPRPPGFFSDPRDWIDLFLMARCDEHVIANSTFSWWGAFLSGDPSPIYPSNWFGWRLNAFIDARLMFPPGWIEVEDPTCGGVMVGQPFIPQERSC